jgi:hypothetical protein
MDTLNKLFVQKYNNLDIRNGAKCMALDPEVSIFTKEVIKSLVPECSDADRVSVCLVIMLSKNKMLRDIIISSLLYLLLLLIM